MDLSYADGHLFILTQPNGYGHPDRKSDQNRNCDGRANALSDSDQRSYRKWDHYGNRDTVRHNHGDRVTDSNGLR